MKVYQTNEIKNIALLGSSGSGENHSRGSDAFREWCYKTSRICCRKKYC